MNKRATIVTRLMVTSYLRSDIHMPKQRHYIEMRGFRESNAESYSVELDFGIIEPSTAYSP